MDNNPTKKVILEIRAGAGGEEAGLFVADLFRMYQRYAAKKKWKVKTLDMSESGMGNLKSISAEITGENAFSLLKNERGVHRVQRVPQTESSGRKHTSTVTVAVLPKITPMQLEINPRDLKVDRFRAQGAGGQNVNKVETAIRITHLPTNTVVSCQNERSQAQNKEKAMEMLRAKLYGMMQEQQKSSLDQLRREQVGTGERSEKIRTYNFHQKRVTDHRLGKSFQVIDKIMDGDLDRILSHF